jgi:hypothetical protein
LDFPQISHHKICMQFFLPSFNILAQHILCFLI